jgi:hypothetical protein
MVNATYQVFAVNVTVSEQCPAVMASAVEYRNLVTITDNDEIYICNEGISRLAIVEFAEISNLCFRHFCRTNSRLSPPMNSIISKKPAYQ